VVGPEAGFVEYLEGKSRVGVGKSLNRLSVTNGIRVPTLRAMEYLIGFYVGAGTTLAFAIGVAIWWQARLDGRLVDSYNEGLEDALNQVAAHAPEARAKLAFVVDPN